MMTAVCPNHLDVMMRTIYGMAGGAAWESKIAISHVILNRVNAQSWWGRDIEDVCHQPGQFACWCDSSLMDVTLAKSVELRECLAAAAAAVWGLEPDPTGGSCDLPKEPMNVQEMS